MLYYFPFFSEKQIIYEKNLDETEKVLYNKKSKMEKEAILFDR